MTYTPTEHAACGVAMIVNLPGADGLTHASHECLKEGLKTLALFDYRSGYNPATGESDGAGVRLFGLPTAFFNRKITEGEFLSPEGEMKTTLLEENNFAIGQYFLPKEQLSEAKDLVEACAKMHGLRVLGWRNLESSLAPEVLSTAAREKQPGIWQAILQADTPSVADDLENTVLQMSVSLAERIQTSSLAMDIFSQSSESIVYKGMIRPRDFAVFFLDLQAPDFIVKDVGVHGRAATNTSPQWRNAQPCRYLVLHNGEFNSARANASEMRQELLELDYPGIYPDPGLSDSMQFDVDLLNQILLHKISLAEAFVRLMPPQKSTQYSDEVNAMLDYFRKLRSPYNGPAFVVAGAKGYFIAKLDDCGLRPSRIALIEYADGQRQLHVSSDDLVEAPPSGRILWKGELQPGGMLLVTPEGAILETKDILDSIAASNRPADKSDFFEPLNQRLSRSLAELSPRPMEILEAPISDIHRALYAAGWDHETQNAILRPMAELGLEATAAMGRDTDPLYEKALPPHLAYFFYQLFAQVSAPSLDSIRERDRFSLETYLGPHPRHGKPHWLIPSPILKPGDLQQIETDSEIKTVVLDIHFTLTESLETLSAKESHALLEKALQDLVLAAEKAVKDGADIIVLSDRDHSPHRALIPDLMAVTAVRKHLEKQHLITQVALVADSSQLVGPHQAAALLAMGAKAVYPHAAYQHITRLYQEENPQEKISHYQHALEKCLLKTMGKLGITDVNNYINGHFMAPLGLDLEPTASDSPPRMSLADLFPFYSPLRGWNFSHIAQGIINRHRLAYDTEEDFSLLPRAGHFMPEKSGIKHGYGPEVVNAFSTWLKDEELRMTLWRLDQLLIKRGIDDFISDRSGFTASAGFIDPSYKDFGDPKGSYPLDYLEQIEVPLSFQQLMNRLDAYRHRHPSSIKDRLYLQASRGSGCGSSTIPLQSKASIRQQLFSGSMSQGALTVAPYDAPDKRKAHETLTLGMNAVHAMSASGEGGEAPADLRNPLHSCQSKQIASGRFGVSAMQIMMAAEIEIKVAQGAKPGEGGEVPGLKISIRFAAQRGGLPGMPFISPPPHHDIYSIEDLAQLIHDIKAVKSSVKVAVKLVSSEGIGTIAVGVAKAGADVINIASHSGGTGAAQQSSIQHAGLPGELGLVEVDKALRKARLRDLVQLRSSGGFKTADDVIVAAILGADQFEFGTTAMLTLGCKMQRTCNKSCQPGVANNGELFKGDALQVERYFAHLASAVQARLSDLGVANLKSLRGRKDLLSLVDPHAEAASSTARSEHEPHYDFSCLLEDVEPLPLLTTEEQALAEISRQELFQYEKEDALVTQIEAFFAEHPEGTYESPVITLNSLDRSFGARIAGTFVHHLEAHPHARIILHTQGIAGQSLGFVCPQGMAIHHQGSVEDGCGKSMTGGELVLRSIDAAHAADNTVAGNAMLYGASHGEAYIEGQVGHRFGILMKGASAVVEGCGDLAFEYMTSGTGFILGPYGKGLCTGATGGIVIVYGEPAEYPDAVRLATTTEHMAYRNIIPELLQKHWEKTGSQKAAALLTDFRPHDFHIFVPKTLDAIQHLQQVSDIIKTYQTKKQALCKGMEVWLTERIRELITRASFLELRAWQKLLRDEAPLVFSIVHLAQLDSVLRSRLAVTVPDIENTVTMAASSTATAAASHDGVQVHPRKRVAVSTRLASLHGALDETLLNALSHLSAYIRELKQDAEGCSGCRAQSCAGGDPQEHNGCPSGKAINSINATLQKLGPIDVHRPLSQAQWVLLLQAFTQQIQESPFIAYTGAACPAPCQDACTESIPAAGSSDKKRGGKPVGEAVHIKDVEYYLFQIGRALAWFDGEKSWSEEEIEQVFGAGGSDSLANKQAYDAALQHFLPPFRTSPMTKAVPDKELIIIGSGPAAMQIAFMALKDGLRVRMYEKSDKPGGLLMDGIPPHKFSKQYLDEDFRRLINMGLLLHLNSEVAYDAGTGNYSTQDGIIGNAFNPHLHVAVCVGAGLPKALAPTVVQDLPAEEKRIVQAIDFLKIANDVAMQLAQAPSLSEEEIDALITERFGAFDPRSKRIVIIGGGDTAQDVIRWLARYFNQSGKKEGQHLSILVRGPELSQRGILDAYPSPSRAPTKENALKAEEVLFVQGESHHLVEPQHIVLNEHGKLKVVVKHSQFKHAELIQSDPLTQALSDALPREMRPIDPSQVYYEEMDNVDLLITALGFQGKRSIPLAAALEDAGVDDISFAGDAAAAFPHIIVGAQASARNTYLERIRPALGIERKPLSALPQLGLFATKRAGAGADTSVSLHHTVSPGV